MCAYGVLTEDVPRGISFTCQVGYDLSIKFVEFTHVLLLGICLTWSPQSCSLVLCQDIRNTSFSNILEI